MSMKGTGGNKRFLKIAEALMEEGYLLGPKIGAGSHSKVRLIERITDGKVFAAKIIDTSKAPKEYVDAFMDREIEIGQNLKHANIVRVHDVFKKGGRMLFFVMEYAEKGDLLEYLMTHGSPPEDRTKAFFRQIVHAVKYLHDKGFAHRDIKCENILLTKTGDAWLTDFGFCRKLEGSGPCETFCGSAAYASPQLIMASPYDPKQNDVWGLGCVLFILVCGCMPFDDTNITRMLQRQQDGVKFPSTVRASLNPEVKTLIVGLLQPDQNKRHTIDDILKDPWFASS